MKQYREITEILEAIEVIPKEDAALPKERREPECFVEIRRLLKKRGSAFRGNWWTNDPRINESYYEIRIEVRTRFFRREIKRFRSDQPFAPD